MDAWYSELNEKKLCYNPRSGKWRSGEFAESQLEDCVVYFYLSESIWFKPDLNNDDDENSNYANNLLYIHLRS